MSAASGYGYEFLDSTYTYKTWGHFGNMTELGKYKNNGDTIYLTPLPKQLQSPSYPFNPQNDTLIIKNDCLIDFSDYFTFCKLEEDSPCNICDKK